MKYFTKEAAVYLPDGSVMKGHHLNAPAHSQKEGGGWGKWLLGGTLAALGGFIGGRYFKSNPLKIIQKAKGGPKPKAGINVDDAIEMVDDGTGTFIPKYSKYYGSEMFKTAVLKKIAQQPLFKTDAKNPQSKKIHNDKSMDLTGEKQPPHKPLKIKDTKEVIK